MASLATATIGKVHEDSSIYEGEWKDGRKHGYGIYYYGEGDKYEGWWQNGCHHGRGKYTWENGDVYDGNRIFVIV